MKAMYYSQFGESPVITTVPDPSCPSDGVILEVASSGLCMSDWHGWQGHDDDIRLPHVPGHEFAGTIVEIGRESQAGFRIGQRVTVPFIQACGHCEWCYNGHSQVCPTQRQAGFSDWGSHAEYVAVSRADFNLIALPHQLSFHAAALLGCRYGTAMHAVQMALEKVKSDGVWVVFGCGGVGLSLVEIASILGQSVIAVDVKEQALELAKQKGAVNTILADKSRIQDQIAAYANKSVAITFDAFGSYGILNQCLDCLSPRGVHIQVGLLPNTFRQDDLSLGRLIAKELVVCGSHGIPRAGYEHLLQFVEEKGINPAAMIDKVVPLQDAVQYFVNHSQQDRRGTMTIDPRLE